MDIVSLLKERGLTISVSESLTSGLVMASIANIPGASAVFLGGVVAYNKDIKASLLSIDRGSIDEFGVYSNYTTTKMAQGVKNLTKSDVAIATSGVAGPYDDEGVKAGDVYFSVIVKDEIHELFMHFEGERNEVREQAVRYIIDKTIEFVK